MMRVSILVLMALWLTGCMTTAEQEQPIKTTVQVVRPVATQNSVHFYTERLAHQLFRSVLTIKPNAGIAIGTFTQIDTLELNETENHPLRLLGLQLEDGFISASVAQGLRVIEFKTRQKLTIKDNQDLMLSRDVTQLSEKQNVQYFLTGTMTEQESGVVVNARLIDTTNNQVIAAATDYVPIDTLWSRNKVQLKQKLIYRSSY